MSRSRNMALAFAALFATASLPLALPVSGEIGVFLRGDRADLDGDLIGTPYVQSIIDLPDPISIWHRHSPIADARRVVLNPNGDANGDGPPAVVFDSGRESTLVLWSRNVAGGLGHKIVLSEFIDGAWTAPRRINTADGQQYDPQVVIGSNGATHIVYWQIQGLEHGVWLQTIGSGPDRALSAPIQVSQPGIAACRPSVAVHQGALLVSYEVHPNGAGTVPKDIVVTSYENDVFLEEVIGTSSHPEPLWPRVHSTGDQAWVDWIDFTSAPYEGDMAWLEKTNTGWSSIAYETFTSQAELEYDVREAIATDAAGPYGGGQAQEVPPQQTP